MCGVGRAVSVLHPKSVGGTLTPAQTPLFLFSRSRFSWMCGRRQAFIHAIVSSFLLFTEGIGVFFPPIIFSGYRLSPVHTPHWQCTTILLCLVHRIKNDRAALSERSDAERLFVIPACEPKICAKNSTKLRLWLAETTDCMARVDGSIMAVSVTVWLWNCIVDKWTLTLVTGRSLYG